jgi:hypothetical protein
LSHSLSPFCFAYFWYRVLCLFLGQPGQPSSFLCFLHSWDDRHVSPHPAFYWLKLGLASFLPRLALNHDIPNFCLLSN